MPNKVYLAREAAVLFRPAAAGGGVALEMASLAPAAGVMSAQLDLGTGSRSGWFAWRLSLLIVSANVLGERVELVMSAGDGTSADGDFGASAAAIPAADKLRNLRSVGGVEIDAAGGGSAVRYTASGLLYAPHRTLALGLWSGLSAASLSATASAHTLTLTPVPDEIQG